jgi:hypothetical protein
VGEKTGLGWLRRGDNVAVTYQPSQYDHIITRHILKKPETQWNIAKINHNFFSGGVVVNRKMLDTGGTRRVK